MFTGIIEELGTISSVQNSKTGARIHILCREVLKDANIGASIAVNGTCLTAMELSESGFVADLSPETLARTSLGHLQTGSPVNLERPLRFNGRLDGHFVLGHVDGTAQVLALNDVGDGNWLLRLQVPNVLSRYIVSKSSVAVDGISLTVASEQGDVVEFAIIPHTFAHTNLNSLQVGYAVNLEVDILAKHLEKLLRK